MQASSSSRSFFSSCKGALWIVQRQLWTVTNKTSKPLACTSPLKHCFMTVHVWRRRKVTSVTAELRRRTQNERSAGVNSMLPGKNVSTISVHCSVFRPCLAARQVIIYNIDAKDCVCAPLPLLEQLFVYSAQITLMDANYVMDETLGTTSFEISKLSLGQKKTEPFLIGKVGHTIASPSLAMYSIACSGRLRLRATVSFWNCQCNPIISKQIKKWFNEKHLQTKRTDYSQHCRSLKWGYL